VVWKTPAPHDDQELVREEDEPEKENTEPPQKKLARSNKVTTVTVKFLCSPCIDVTQIIPQHSQTCTEF